MPNYSFIRKSTEEQWDDTMTIAQMTELLENDKDIAVVIKPLGNKVRDNFISGVGTRIKTNGDFENLLQNIKSHNPGSTIEY